MPEIYSILYLLKSSAFLKIVTHEFEAGDFFLTFS